MASPRCPICGRADDMEWSDAGRWLCRNPPCSYQRAVAKAPATAREPAAGGRPREKDDTRPRD